MKCLVVGVLSLLLASVSATSVYVPSYSVEECAALGGSVIGDPGDGSVVGPGYICSSGSPPIGPVVQEGFIEGAVCCLDGAQPPPPPFPPAPPALPGLTIEQCTAVGGSVVGSIGTGEIFQPDYVCESNGLPPLGQITNTGFIEGAVCCGGGSAPTPPAPSPPSYPPYYYPPNPWYNYYGYPYYYPHQPYNIYPPHYPNYYYQQPPYQPSYYPNNHYYYQNPYNPYYQPPYYPYQWGH